MQDIKAYLDEQVARYNNIGFIENDPISIPHQFTSNQDIEIAGLFAAILAWGNRKSILKSANQLMQWLDHAPYDFIMHHSENDLKPFYKFTYRTFNGHDCVSFIRNLNNIYTRHGSIEQLFTQGYQAQSSILDGIVNFRSVFFENSTNTHTFKHVANPLTGSAAKRLNMYLRWMVRKDNAGVDFGIWKIINPAHLMIPLDLHSGNIARRLGILQRTNNDWRAVVELTERLKEWDVADPVKYDFALFSLGVNKVI